jgi:hypothetical protein
VFVSKNLTDPAKPCFTSITDAGIFKKPWFTYTDKNNTSIPMRTTNPTHAMGYSDHYPVFLVLHVVKH